MDTQEYSPWKIWKEALRFYHTNIDKFIFIFPLLFIPVFVDALLTIMIVQKRTSAQINVSETVTKAISKTGVLFFLKLRYEVSGGLWSLIPIFGWFKVYRHRTYWAMASNVIAYENLPMHLAIRRCPQLIDFVPIGKCFRTLITIPTLIEVLLLIAIGVGTIVLDNSIIFIIGIISFFWTFLPWSAAVNTILYFSLPQDKVKETLNELRIIRSYEDYCPECKYLLRDQGICEKLQFKIFEYSSQFEKKCNAKYFESRGVT